MRLASLSTVGLVLAGLLSSNTVAAFTERDAQRVSPPIAFEANQGQAPTGYPFVVRGAGYGVLLKPDIATLRLAAPPKTGNKRRHRTSEPGEATVVSTRLIGANPVARGTAEGKLSSYSNYFLGEDPKAWIRNAPNYERVRFNDVYRGIDLVYYGNQTQLEYDFVVEPGADLGKIKFALEGAKNARIDPKGDLVLDVKGGQLIQHAPIAWQTIDGTRVPVEARFTLDRQAMEVAFDVAAYDRAHTLYIDPVLTYSSYLGGAGQDIALDIALDGSGNSYITGYTTGSFPTVTPLQSDDGNPDYYDAFITKINAAGNQILWSTYIGGLQNDQATSIAVDGSGIVAIVGTTTGEFPIQNAFQQTPGSAGQPDAFVARVSADGATLLLSSYIGGSQYDAGEAVAYASGSLVVAGYTDGSFPTRSPFQSAYGGEGDAFIAKINHATNQVTYASYLGGTTYDLLDGLAVAASGDIYVAGSTDGGFPVKNAVQATFGGGGLDDAFVARIKGDGTAVTWATYLGGSKGDGATDIAVDSSGNAYVVGYTQGSFPTVSPVQPTYGGNSDAFAAKVNAAGTSISFATYLGGAGVDSATSAAVDGSGNLLVGGYTSGSFPVINAAQSAFGGGGKDGLAVKLTTSGAQIVWASYLGGSTGDSITAIAADSAGYAVVTGSTDGGFPTTSALQATPGGGSDVFFARLGHESTPPTLTLTVSPSSIDLGQSATLSWSTTGATACTASGSWSGSYATSGTQSVTPTTAGSPSYSMTCSGSGGSVSKSVTLTVTAPPPVPTLTLTAEPPSIHLGDSTTLSWNANDATSCTASGSWSGAKPVSGAQNITPTSTGNKAFSLACTGDGGSVSKSVTVNVTNPPPAPTVSISVSPASITTGQSSTLTWTSTEATACTASGAWSGSKAISGSQTVAPTSTGNYTYEIACSGDGGTTTKSASLIVSAPTPAPSVNLTVSPTSIFRGSSSTLSWSSTNSTSCAASGAWSGTKATSGTQTVTPATTGTFSYTLSCTGTGGTTDKTVSLTVNAPAPTLTLTVSPTTITLGSAATLTWAPADASSCTASGAWSGTKSSAGGSQSVSPTTVGNHAYQLACTGAGGSVTKSVTPTVTDAIKPPTVTISVNPSSITLGNPSTLSWNSTDATSCSASGAWSGSKATSGSQSVAPTSTGSHTYTLACTGTGGTTTQSAVLTVSAPAPTLAFTVAPTTITIGSSASLDWSASNATACTASGDWSGSKATIGNQTVTPTTIGEKTFSLSCTGSGGSVSKSVTLTVRQLPPAITIAVNPTSITQGNSATISWGTTNATSCVASGAWTGSKATSGSQSTTPTSTGSFSYTLACDGPGGSSTQSATLTVNPPVPPTTITFTASPATIVRGSSSTLSWSTTGATSCEASGEWTGARGTSGSAVVTPTSTGVKNYALSCTGTGGTSTKNVTVTVNTPAPTLTITPSPATITLGQSSTLSWSAADVTSCTASGEWSGTKAAAGSQTVTPTSAGTKNFVLSCTGDGGSVSKTASLVVNTPTPAPTVDIVATPTTIALGASTTLSWTSSDASSCSATGAWSGAKGTSGSTTITPSATGSFSYGLSCTGTGGTSSDSLSVTVTAPAPTLSFTGTPTSITVGQSTSLSWGASNATSCSASGAWTGSKTTSGSQTVTPASAGTSSYVMSCTGTGGSVSKTVSITATAAPQPTISIGLSPSTITVGQASTLTWASSNSTSCVASGAWSGSQATSGSLSVNPSTTGTHNYAIQCTGSGGTASSSATLTVNASAPTLTLSASPMSFTLGGSTTLSWTSTNSTSCTASDAWTGTKATSGSQSVTPTSAGSKTFALACTGSGGTVTKQVTVTVNSSAPAITIAVNPATVTRGSASTLSWTAANATSCSASGAWSGAQPTSGSVSVVPTSSGAYAYQLTCTGPGGTGSGSATLTVNDPPPTLTFTSSPGSIAYGATSTLSWAATDSSACTASNAWTGSKATSGSQTVTPASSGTFSYVLTCTGSGGSISKTATVTVASPPSPTLTLTASPTSMYVGSTTTVTWSAVNVTACTATGAWSGSKASSGSATFTPASTGNFSYGMTCTGPGGSVTKAVNVAVNPYPLPTVNLTISPSSINILQTATVTWSTSYATSCVASGSWPAAATAGEWSGDKPLSGSQTANANLLAPTKTYTLTCTGPGGTTSKSATLQTRLL